MRKLFDRLNERLVSFVEQRDDLALILKCGEGEVAIVQQMLQALDEGRSSELYWTFSEEFREAPGWVTGAVETFGLKHEAVRILQAQKGLRVWPEMPPVLLDGAAPAVHRLRELMTFARTLLPHPEGLAVFALLPLKIHDGAAWGTLVRDVLKHEYPFPWCHHLRIVAREDAAAPSLKLDGAPRVGSADVDFSQPSMQKALEQEVADPSVPVEARMQSTLVLAALDHGWKRFDEALKKYELLLVHYLQTENHAMTAVVLNGLGELHQHKGDLQKADAYYESALAPAARCAYPPVPALLNIFRNLAARRAADGRWAEAAVYYDGAEKLATVQRDPRTKIQSIEQLAECQLRAGRPDDAVFNWELAASIAKELEQPELRTSILGRLKAHFERTGDHVRRRAVEAQLAELSRAVS